LFKVIVDYPVIQKAWKKGCHSLDIVYPNKKCGGCYNLGMLIIYNIVNNLPNWVCNRIFLDEGRITSELVGFTFQYEMDYYNMFKLLRSNKIPLEKKRNEILFAGGPCVNTNPHALANFMDFLVLGDAEETLPKVLLCYEQSDSKDAFLQRIATLEGVYVPGVSKKETYCYVSNLDNAPYPLYQPLPTKLTKDYVFGNAFLLEVERGCPFACKFCPLPQQRKTRYRSLEKLKEIIDKGVSLNKRQKVVLYTPSFSHPQKKDILKYMLDKGLGFSVPSIKVEITDEELLWLIKEGGQKTLTIAPECNESLRFEIGKNVSDASYLHFVELAQRLGFEEIKCYFMLGLPNQTKEDLEKTIVLIKQLKERFANLYVSINPFVSKLNTPFAEYGFDAKRIEEQAAFLKKALRDTKIRVKIQSIKAAKEEWLLAHANFE